MVRRSSLRAQAAPAGPSPTQSVVLGLSNRGKHPTIVWGSDADACRVLWNALPTVSADDWDRLERPLSLAEFSEALRLMPTNKSPGMDRLTVEFWDKLGPDLVTVWAKSLGSQVLCRGGEPYSPCYPRRGTSVTLGIGVMSRSSAWTTKSW
ncbi:unnamed protein product [Caretta caretta]